MSARSVTLRMLAVAAAFAILATISVRAHAAGPLGTTRGVQARWAYNEPVRETKQRIQVRVDAASYVYGQRATLERLPGARLNDGRVEMGLIQGGTRSNGVRGKLAFFSMWNATATTNPGRCQSFGGEDGTGLSCRLDLDWIEGRSYALVLRFLYIDPPIGTWYNAFVQDTQTGETQMIGRLAAPATVGTYIMSSSNFIEYFGPLPTGACNRIDRASLAVRPPLGFHGDGSIIPSRHVTSQTPEPDCLRGTDASDGTDLRLLRMGTGFPTSGTAIEPRFSGVAYGCNRPDGILPLYENTLVNSAFGWLPAAPPVRYVVARQTFTTTGLANSAVARVLDGRTTYLAPRAHLCAY